MAVIHTNLRDVQDFQDRLDLARDAAPTVVEAYDLGREMFGNLDTASPTAISETELTGSFGFGGSYLITGHSLADFPAKIDHITLQDATPVTLELDGQVTAIDEDTFEGKITHLSYQSDTLDFDVEGKVRLQDLEDGRVKFQVSSFSLDIDGPVDVSLSFQGHINVHNDKVSGNVKAAALEVDGGYIRATDLHRPATHLDIEDASTILSSFLSGNDTIYGEGTDQTLNGYRGNDTIHAGSGNDTLLGDRGNDTLNGNAGDDLANGGNGNDRLFGGADDDTLGGDSGNDKLYGGDGDDTLNGGTGHDKLYGNAGNDTINGEGGNDEVNGGDGDDTLDGGTGVDRLNGGLGDDTLVWDAADTKVNGNEGTDVLQLAGADLTLDLTAQPGNKIRDIEGVDLTGTGNNTLILSADDVISISETDTLTITGDSGDELELSDTGWVAGFDSVIDTLTYHSYTNGSATLLVLEDVSVAFPL